jgi:hypothetical protein
MFGLETNMNKLEFKLFVAFVSWIILTVILVWAPFPVPRRFLTIAFNLTWPMIFFAGLIIATRALLYSGNKAHWLFIVYFALALYSKTAGPLVNDWVRGIKTNPPEPEMIEKRQKFADEMIALYQKYQLPPSHAKSTISLPLGQLLLLAGYWLLTAKTKKSEQQFRHVP